MNKSKNTELDAKLVIEVLRSQLSDAMFQVAMLQTQINQMNANAGLSVVPVEGSDTADQGNQTSVG